MEDADEVVGQVAQCGVVAGGRRRGAGHRRRGRLVRYGQGGEGLGHARASMSQWLCGCTGPSHGAFLLPEARVSGAGAGVVPAGFGVWRSGAGHRRIRPGPGRRGWVPCPGWDMMISASGWRPKWALHLPLQEGLTCSPFGVMIMAISDRTVQLRTPRPTSGGWLGQLLAARRAARITRCTLAGDVPPPELASAPLTAAPWSACAARAGSGACGQQLQRLRRGQLGEGRQRGGESTPAADAGAAECAGSAPRSASYAPARPPSSACHDVAESAATGRS